MGLKWADTEALALQLLAKNPDIRPADVAEQDLPRWVSELPDFDDDPSAPPPDALRALYQRWRDEWAEVNA